MDFEIEKKFRIKDPDVTWQRILSEYKGQLLAGIEQSDLYLQHPVRDFAATDEALRIRNYQREGQPPVSEITWKGPRLDPAGAGAKFKTRKEINLRLDAASNADDAALALFEELGFRAVYRVKKTRSVYRATVSAWPVEFALDQVEGLGSFVEIEICAAEHEINKAQEVVASISQALGLTEPLTLSYLEMLLP